MCCVRNLSRTGSSFVTIASAASAGQKSQASTVERSQTNDKAPAMCVWFAASHIFAGHWKPSLLQMSIYKMLLFLSTTAFRVGSVQLRAVSSCVNLLA